MSALDDITLRLKSLPPVPKGKRRVIVVGPSAMRALQTDMKDGGKPKFIRASLADPAFEVVETSEFKGWDIVDRGEPNRPFSLAAKHR